MVGTRPSLLASSDWSRDALGLYVAADDRRDLDAPAQSRTDSTASLGGSLDIGRDRLTLAVAHIDNHEDRTQLDALPTDRPVPFQVDDARASYAWLSGRWTVTPTVEASSWHYGAKHTISAEMAATIDLPGHGMVRIHGPKPGSPMAKRSHLKLRHQTYFAVLDVPQDARRKIGKTRFVKSLETDSASVAERRAAPILAAWRRQVAEARGDTSGEDDAAFYRRALLRAKTASEREAIVDRIGEEAADIAMDFA